MDAFHEWDDSDKERKEVEINYEWIHSEICTLTKDIYAPVKPPVKFTWLADKTVLKKDSEVSIPKGICSYESSLDLLNTTQASGS